MNSTGKCHPYKGNYQKLRISKRTSHATSGSLSKQTMIWKELKGKDDDQYVFFLSFLGKRGCKVACLVL